MILPGTLVQYVRNTNPKLRPNGVYTVRTYHPGNPLWRCSIHGDPCHAPSILLCEADPAPKGEATHCGRVSNGYFGLCGFRILAPPITEADRLEMTAPGDGGRCPVPAKLRAAI